MRELGVVMPLDINTRLLQFLPILNTDIPQWIKPTRKQSCRRLFRQILHTLHPGADVLIARRDCLLGCLGEAVVRKAEDPVALQVVARVVLGSRRGV